MCAVAFLYLGDTLLWVRSAEALRGCAQRHLEISWCRRGRPPLEGRDPDFARLFVHIVTQSFGELVREDI